MKPSKPEISEIEVRIAQDADCCDPNPDCTQYLTLATQDGGGGWFWVISTDRWAFDSADDLTGQLKSLISHLEVLEPSLSKEAKERE